MCYRGVVKNGVVVLESASTFPEGMEVQVSPLTVQSKQEQEANQQSLRDFLMSFAGTIQDLPEDMAKNHDHYLHGRPKK